MKNLDPQAYTEIKEVLGSITDLKPLPATVIRALKLMDNPNASIQDIATALSMDQALTARILRRANSAYYGFPYSATTLQEAITRLGFRQIKNILFTLSYSSILGQQVSSYNLGSGELWRHSVAVAITAQQLAERVAYPAADEAYISGLLHDIGKLVLDQYFKVDWNQLLATGKENGLSLSEAEERLFGMNHAQVGSELAAKWSLPPRLVEAIAYHHTPVFANRSPELTGIVHIANIICLRLDIGLPDPVFLAETSTEALRLLFLEPNEIDVLVDQYKEKIEHSLTLEEELISSGTY